jgi:hypothetical protein
VAALEIKLGLDVGDPEIGEQDATWALVLPWQRPVGLADPLWPKPGHLSSSLLDPAPHPIVRRGRRRASPPAGPTTSRPTTSRPTTSGPFPVLP